MVSASDKGKHVTITRLLTGLACIAATNNTQAQASQATDSDNRLSSHLLKAPPAVHANSQLWVSDPSLKLEQRHLKESILGRLGLRQGAPGITELFTYLETLPLSGRLTPSPNDAAALLALPSSDYRLTTNTLIQHTSVPPLVTVLNGDGQMCQVTLNASASVERLLANCPSLPPGDEAWVIQADGTIHRTLTSSWNRYAEVLVAPGSWVWRPTRQLQEDLALSADIAHFLATQPLPVPGAGNLPSPVLPPVATDSAEAQQLGWKPYQSANDWGETGLLQTPSARTAGLGSIRLTMSRTYPYTRMNVFLQPTGWLEFGFRYTDIATALYGPSIAGEQTYKDKSFDFKTVLSQEDSFWPQIALGMRDIGGTGLFSSEYVVASKRTDSLDWSLGIGWGNMAGGSALANPLGSWFPSLKQRRKEDFGQGGAISGANMFAGNAALFGGVQWTSPAGQHVMKLEVEGNRYSEEPFNQDHSAASPVNLGWLYRITPGIDFTVALERGNKLGVAFTFTDNMRTLASTKPLDPPSLGAAQLTRARTTPLQAMGISAIAPNLHEQIRTAIHAQSGWTLLSLEKDSGTWQLVLETDDAIYASERLERVIDVLCATLPNEGHTLELELRNFGLALRTVTVHRAEWLAQRTYPDLPALQLNALQASQPGMHGFSRVGNEPSLTNTITQRDRLETGWGMVFSPILGGPNNFVLYQAGLRGYGQYRFNDNTWAFAQANLRLLDNYATFDYDAPSNLPRVRTDQRQYVTTSRTTLPVAQLTRTFDLGHGHHASAYGGLLEPMYAGVGAEWLWRPWNSSWAFGVDVNQVQQRGYAQDLALRDYRTTTGHATLYWNTGFNGVLAKISAGKYLAKDVGATFDISRTFANGTSIGVWATKTNISAEQYGEGSFDKGIYISIPFDAVLPRSNASTATLQWSPLSRDGGAKLGRQFPLYELTRHADRATWQYRSAQPERNRQEELQEPASLLRTLLPYRSGPDSLGSTMQLGSAVSHAEIDARTWAVGAGALLLTMAADQTIADKLGPGAGSSSSGKALGNIPYLLAAGVGSAAVGMWGEDARSTAYASVSATTWTLGTNLLGKSLIGRSRPDEGYGAWDFRGPHSGSPQSSFASNHVTAAMALVTPFAQRYNQPWLYGLASLTALGRIQSNDHWASDTLAGGLLGYAFGTLALENQNPKRAHWTINASLNQIEASMRY